MMRHWQKVLVLSGMVAKSCDASEIHMDELSSSESNAFDIEAQNSRRRQFTIDLLRSFSPSFVQNFDRERHSKTNYLNNDIMQAILQHEFAQEFFNGPGRDQYSFTSPHASLRHEDCAICYDALLCANPCDQKILLTHVHCLETIHAECLLKFLTIRPDRCPYCRQTIVHGIPRVHHIEQFGELILSEPDRETFNNTREAITALQQYASVLDELFTMFWDEWNFISKDDEFINQNFRLTAIEIEERSERDALRAIALNELSNYINHTEMLIAYLNTDSMLDLSWLSRTELFRDMQEWFNFYSRERYQLTIGAFLLVRSCQ